MNLNIPEGDFEAYIFDCDGTLADSMPVHYTAWSYAFQSHGAKFDFTWDVFYNLAGVGLHDTVRILNERYEDSLDPDDVVAAQMAKLDEEQHKITPIHDVVALARKFAQTHPVAVASGGIQEDVLETLRIIDVLELFPVIVTKQDVERSKPAPDTFLLAAERMNIAPDKCLVFEDSMLGIQAAELAGMQWCFVDPKHYSSGGG